MAKKRRKRIQPNPNFFVNTLARFRPISYNNLDALKNDRLYYSTPSNFNDPYDTLIYADYLQIIKDIYHNLTIGMDSYLDNLKNKDIPNAMLWAGFGYAMWNGSKKDETLGLFLKEIYEATKTLKNTLRKNVKIICFAEDYLSMLMWSHYADNHKGFAIIYDKNSIENAENYTISGDIIKKSPILKQVTYAEKQSDLTSEIENYVRAYRMETLEDIVPPTPNLSQDKLKKMITEKSPDWSYEKEWRIIPRHISLEQESNLGYMSIKPKGIILGSMCSDEDQCQIIHICDKKTIPVFKSELNYWEPGYKLALMEPDRASLGIE